MLFSGIKLDSAPPLDIPMRFFIAGPLFGVVAGIVILLHGSLPFRSSWEMETFALTHLITLGSITMIMFGALYQMIPVLAGVTVPWISLAKWVHLVTLIGIIAFYFGFHYQNLTFFKIAFGSFLFSFSGFFVPIFFALLHGAKGKPTVWAMLISVISLFVTLIFGLIFLWNYSFAASYGLVNLWVRRDFLIALHAGYGLIGWMLTLIMGVGFHVIPMFYLTPTFNEAKSRKILFGVALTLIVLPFSVFWLQQPLAIYLSFLPSAIATTAFVQEVFSLLRKRKRKITEATIYFWETGLTLFYFVGGLFFLSYFFSDSRLYVFVVTFLLFGVFNAIVNGMLYKIVPFLVWFHRFSQHIGKRPTPTMKDIIAEKNARNQWKIFVVAMIFLGVGIALRNDPIIRFAGLLIFFSYLFLFLLVYKALRTKLPPFPDPVDVV